MKYRIKQSVLLIVICIGGFSNAQTGIGTTVPVNKFQIEATIADPATTGAAANGNLRLSGTSGSHVLDFGLSSSSTYSWLQARSKSAYGTTFSLLLNPIGGNVGIGTTSPGDPLVVGTFAIHDSGHKVIGFGWSPGTNKALLTGYPAEIRLDPANGRLSFGTSTTSYATGATPVLTPRLFITSQGNVGVGTATPSVHLQVAGDIIANSIAGSSDVRFKQNIFPIQNALQKVMQLQGVTFDWKKSEFPNRTFSDQKTIGFIAQDVEKVLPEVVQTEKTTEGYKAVQYDKVVALLVEAIKEQQKEIDVLKQQIKQLKRDKK
jgi:hypothetical protein